MIFDISDYENIKEVQLYPYNFIKRFISDHPDIRFTVIAQCQQCFNGSGKNLWKLGILSDSWRTYPLNNIGAARCLLLPVTFRDTEIYSHRVTLTVSCQGTLIIYIPCPGIRRDVRVS